REIIEALASTYDVVQQRAALGLILDAKLDIRDTQFMVFGANRDANRLVAQQFLKDNQDAIMKRIPSEGTTSGQSWLAFVFTSSCTAERRAEIADYVTSSFGSLPGGARTVQQAIEAMDQCIARRKLMEPELRSWLASGRGISASAKASK